jgi:hypothetical protein
VPPRCSCISRDRGFRAGAAVKVYTITAGLKDVASLEQPDRITPRERTVEYRPDLTIALEAYTVAVVEITAR